MHTIHIRAPLEPAGSLLVAGRRQSLPRSDGQARRTSAKQAMAAADKQEAAGNAAADADGRREARGRGTGNCSIAASNMIALPRDALQQYDCLEVRSKKREALSAGDVMEL